MQILQQLKCAHSALKVESRDDTRLIAGSTQFVRFIHRTAIIFCCLLSVSACLAGGTVRIQDQFRIYEGKVVALSRKECSLIDRDGRLHKLAVPDIKRIKRLSPNFVPLPYSKMRSELKKEFSTGYEISSSKHYLVCAPAGRAAQYAKLFEDVYRDIENFYSVRGFEIHDPEFLLVAIVFRSKEEFDNYADRENISGSGLMGYYSLLTNRVALFDNQNLAQNNLRLIPSLHLATADRPALTRSSDGAFLQETATLVSAIAGESAKTVIHETIHQVGFNIGIHSRLGGSPTWIVEGLATALEPPAMRKKSGRDLLSNRLNEERSRWFHDVLREKRPRGFLAALVASDENFHRNLLHSYSESWAFTFFLLENGARRSHLVNYLKVLAKRDPMKPYSARQRLEDFETAFGDIPRVEVEFIRYMDRIQQP